MQGSYTRGEVVFLLSLSRDQAIDMDAHPRDSCAGLSDDHESGGGDDDSGVMVIARWLDVQRAKKAIVRDKESLAILQLRAGGFGERELGRLMGTGQMAVRRRAHATVTEILEHLGGATWETDPDSRVDACLACGSAPRIRLAAVRRRVRGGWVEVLPERQSSVCTACLDDKFDFRNMGRLATAA